MSEINSAKNPHQNVNQLMVDFYTYNNELNQRLGNAEAQTPEQLADAARLFFTDRPETADPWANADAAAGLETSSDDVWSVAFNESFTEQSTKTYSQLSEEIVEAAKPYAVQADGTELFNVTREFDLIEELTEKLGTSGLSENGMVSSLLKLNKNIGFDDEMLMDILEKASLVRDEHLMGIEIAEAETETEKPKTTSDVIEYYRNALAENGLNYFGNNNEDRTEEQQIAYSNLESELREAVRLESDGDAKKVTELFAEFNEKADIAQREIREAEKAVNQPEQSEAVETTASDKVETPAAENMKAKEAAPAKAENTEAADKAQIAYLMAKYEQQWEAARKYDPEMSKQDYFYGLYQMGKTNFAVKNKNFNDYTKTPEAVALGKSLGSAIAEKIGITDDNIHEKKEELIKALKPYNERMAQAPTGIKARKIGRKVFSIVRKKQ